MAVRRGLIFFFVPYSLHSLKIGATHPQSTQSCNGCFLAYIQWTHPQTRSQRTYFTRDETGLVCLPTQLERTLQLYW
jgi:hypothetical protein